MAGGLAWQKGKYGRRDSMGGGPECERVGAGRSRHGKEVLRTLAWKG